MSTYRELLNWGQEILELAKVPDASVDAWELMEFVFAMEKSCYFLCRDDKIEDESRRKRYRELIRQMNASSGTKVAVDIPSGVSADTGQVLGIAFAADYTVTFQARKIGLLLYPGKEYAGQVIPREIGISEAPLEQDPGTAVLLSEQEYAQLLPERPEDSHKGTYGRQLVIAGSKGMSGAAFFNAAAAYAAGAGLVQIYTPEENRPILQQLLPEAIISCYGR